MTLTRTYGYFSTILANPVFTTTTVTGPAVTYTVVEPDPTVTDVPEAPDDDQPEPEDDPVPETDPEVEPKP